MRRRPHIWGDAGFAFFASQLLSNLSPYRLLFAIVFLPTTNFRYLLSVSCPLLLLLFLVLLLLLLLFLLNLRAFPGAYFRLFRRYS